MTKIEMTSESVITVGRKFSQRTDSMDVITATTLISEATDIKHLRYWQIMLSYMVFTAFTVGLICSKLLVKVVENETKNEVKIYKS